MSDADFYNKNVYIFSCPNRIIMALHFGNRSAIFQFRNPFLFIQFLSLPLSFSRSLSTVFHLTFYISSSEFIHDHFTEAIIYRWIFIFAHFSPIVKNDNGFCFSGFHSNFVSISFIISLFLSFPSAKNSIRKNYYFK